jgi:hypothetical protein
MALCDQSKPTNPLSGGQDKGVDLFPSTSPPQQKMRRFVVMAYVRNCFVLMCLVAFLLFGSSVLPSNVAQTAEQVVQLDDAIELDVRSPPLKNGPGIEDQIPPLDPNEGRTAQIKKGMRKRTHRRIKTHHPDIFEADSNRQLRGRSSPNRNRGGNRKRSRSNSRSSVRTFNPTPTPSVSPSRAPAGEPSAKPSITPSNVPSSTPSSIPTVSSQPSTSSAPSLVPSVSMKPSQEPSFVFRTFMPTIAPTEPRGTLFPTFEKSESRSGMMGGRKGGRMGMGMGRSFSSLDQNEFDNQLQEIVEFLPPDFLALFGNN